MRKTISGALALLLSLAMVFSFTACTDETPEEPTTEFILKDTVPEESVVDYINTLVAQTLVVNPAVNADQKFDISNTKALTPADYEKYLNGEELTGDEALDKLDDTLGFIKGYLMEHFESEKPALPLKTIDEAKVVSIVDYDNYTARNWKTENVLDEEDETQGYDEDRTKYYFDMRGNELTNEPPVTDAEGVVVTYANGDLITKDLVSDNQLKARLSFYKPATEENAPLAFADPAVINEYFADSIDKAYVLTELAKVNTAIAVNDYDVRYRDCNIFYVMNMDTNRLLSVTFTKTSFVTFDTTGAGSFADLGDFKIIFDFRDTLTYTFDYDAAAEDTDTDSSDVSAEADEPSAEPVTDEPSAEASDETPSAEPITEEPSTEAASDEPSTEAVTDTIPEENSSDLASETTPEASTPA